ncbi:MAG TPA: OmpA family protein [Syntrophus sp. (in: bacteria)]|jgi:outer membrane protein OmpA-like peptidoglycan-associated protein|nr:OmpA family protein [Syntrophus sp. (in: bacteria)]
MKNKSLLRVRNIFPPLVLFLLLISGCASTTQVVLLPDPDGKVGTLEVSNVKGTQTLNQAWQATVSASMDRIPSEPKLLEEEKVRQVFREALEAEPIPPVSFIVYFRTDRSVLSTESLTLLTNVMHAIMSRKSTDIIISGHTDAVGAIDYNHRLSLRRAKAVADILIARGIDRQNIQVSYHGKGNPLVPTPDGRPEPRNRRVEITVR